LARRRPPTRRAIPTAEIDGRVINFGGWYYAAFLYPDLLAMFGRWGIVPMTAVVFAAGGATYWLIEAPVMRLRPRSAPVSA
jgi:hypothetical protein